ncbi:MAG: hypothetical protein ACOX5I_06245 [Gleimia sp.]
MERAQNPGSAFLRTQFQDNPCRYVSSMLYFFRETGFRNLLTAEAGVESGNKLLGDYGVTEAGL